MKILQKVPRQDGHPVVFSTDNNYFNYAIVAIQSLMDHAKERLCIYVLTDESDMEDFKNRLSSLLTIPSSCSVTAMSIDDVVDFETLQLQDSAYITKATYYRLVIPELMSEWDRVLYLDSDLCVMDPIDELFAIDDGDWLVAGCKDFEFVRIQLSKSSKFATNSRQIDIQNAMKKKYGTVKEWYAKELNLDADNGFDSYMNAGVCLFNIKACRDFRFTEKAFRLIEEQYAKNNWMRFNDQDAINSICYGRIKWLDPKWNALWYYGTHYALKISFKRRKLEKEGLAYNESIQGAHIWHYLCGKPWDKPYMDYGMAMHWWRACKRTPVFSECLSRMSPTIQASIMSRMDANAEADSIEQFC